MEIPHFLAYPNSAKCELVTYQKAIVYANKLFVFNIMRFQHNYMLIFDP